MCKTVMACLAHLFPTLIFQGLHAQHSRGRSDDEGRRLVINLVIGLDD